MKRRQFLLRDGRVTSPPPIVPHISCRLPCELKGGYDEHATREEPQSISISARRPDPIGRTSSQVYRTQQHHGPSKSIWALEKTQVDFMISCPLARRVSAKGPSTVWQCPNDFRFRPESRHQYQTSACLKGRVEDGRGSWRPMAIAPFPIPAHRTGRAALPHPALRLASPRGTRRCS